ncbi:helix-turn-helix domain-containing protein [Kitasatospora sp. NPDC059599]|uniref:helix-turn-helix domain-containing protein n=1 Tax=Kitasatospora sp. NPDC059599 TaxID=3346880 RepID=UPI0036AB4A07
MSTEDLGPAKEAALAELRRQLDDKRAGMGLDKTQLARRAGVSRGTVHNVFAGPVPRAVTVTALARALRLDPDVLLALRRIAAGEAPAPAGAGVPGPAEDRLLFLFRAGSAVGSAVPLRSTGSERFEEFLEALRLIGLAETETAPLREIRTRLEQTDRAGLALLTAYAGVLDEVVSLIEKRTSRAEFRFFLVGKLLQGIALFAATEWPSAPDIEDARTELFYLSDAVDIPEELRAEVKGYCRVELPAAEQMTMFGEAERLSGAFHAIL